MSARPIMMTGVIYPLDKMHPPLAVAFVGNSWDPTLAIGGGPIIPETPGQPGQPPHPAFPIWGPPGIIFPPGPGYPPVVGGGPIIPPIPPEPPTDPSIPKPPPPEGGWGWHPEYGWGYFPMGGGKPQPPGS
jgi:hypothetical protein